MEQDPKVGLKSPVSLKLASGILLLFTVLMLFLWAINSFERLSGLQRLQNQIGIIYLLYLWPMILEFSEGRRVRWHFLFWLFCGILIQETLSSTLKIE